MSVKTNTAFMTSLAVAAAVVCAASVASAETETETEMTNPYQEILNLPVKMEQAMGVASEAATGDILEITLDEFDETPVYFATLASPTSLSEVIISAEDASVIATQVQTAATAELMAKFFEEEEDAADEFFEAALEDALDDLTEEELEMELADLEDCLNKEDDADQ